MDSIGTLALWATILFLYFVPAFLAAGKKRNSTSIFWLNLLLGWSLIGWVVALIWALTKDTPNQPTTSNTGVATEIERLKTLLDNGHITTEEFNKGKSAILNR